MPCPRDARADTDSTAITWSPAAMAATDQLANLAAVCPTHHRMLVPHGTKALAGNPNLPDGLELVDANDRPPP